MFDPDSKKPMFMYGKKKVESFSLYVNSVDAIKQLADKKGIKVSVLVDIIFEEWLSALVNRGVLVPPKDQDK
jgi:hypothetical protein